MRSRTYPTDLDRFLAALGLSYAAAAEQIGIPRSMLWRLARGERDGRDATHGTVRKIQLWAEQVARQKRIPVAERLQWPPSPKAAA